MPSINPLISICIPAYGRGQLLAILLDSIKLQTYKDYEVVISDDSNTNEISKLVDAYKPYFSIQYQHNNPAYGMPANWNVAVALAKGEWIKMMHDDDRFATEHSLMAFANAIDNNKKFIFSAFSNVDVSSNKIQPIQFSKHWLKLVLDNPLMLMAQNIIGPPSVTMVHKSLHQPFNTKFVWRVDVEYYIRLLLEESTMWKIDQPLVFIGISQTQITQSAKGNAGIELPEMLILFKKYGSHHLQNIRMYDMVWRTLRNLKIRSAKALNQHTPNQQWPPIFYKIIGHQTIVPHAFLQIGMLSKCLMLLSFVTNYRGIKSE